MTVPSYSLIIETANLSLADLDGLRGTLDSLAVQTLPVQNALRSASCRQRGRSA